MLLAVLYSVTIPGLKLRALELHELELLELLEPEPGHKLVLVLVRLPGVDASAENVACEDLGSCFGFE